MDLPKVVVGAPVVRRHRNISAPNRGFLEVTGTLGQGFAVRALIDLHSQTDGRDLQRSQVTARVIEIACHFGVAGGGSRCFRGSRGIHSGDRTSRDKDRGGGAVDRRAGGGHGSGRQVGGEGRPGVQGIGAGGTESRRDQGGVFADVLILPCPSIRGDDRLKGGGGAVVRIARCVDGILQRSRRARGNCQGGGQAHQAEKRTQFFHSVSSSLSCFRL